MVGEPETITQLFRGFDCPRLMLTVAVPYIEAALVRQNGRCSCWEAAGALISQIRAGRLLAYGDDDGGTERVIPINDFANADPFPGASYSENPQGQRVLRWLDGGSQGERRQSDFIEESGNVLWRNINVETSEVLRLWPWEISKSAAEIARPQERADGFGGSKKPPLPISKYKALKDFLDNHDPGNEDDARDLAEKHFDAFISRDVLREHRVKKGQPGRKRTQRPN